MTSATKPHVVFDTTAVPELEAVLEPALDGAGELVVGLAGDGGRGAIAGSGARRPGILRLT